MERDPRMGRLVTRYSKIAWCVIGAGIVCFVVGASLHVWAVARLMMLGFALGMWIMAAMFVRRPERDGQPIPRHPLDILVAVGLVLGSTLFVGMFVLSLMAPGPSIPLTPARRAVVLAITGVGLIGAILFTSLFVWGMILARREGRPPEQRPGS